jgi:hypothetical protein
MYRAIENAASMVSASGILYIALYNENRKIMEGTSVFWVNMKKLYNKST